MSMSDSEAPEQDIDVKVTPGGSPAGTYEGIDSDQSTQVLVDDEMLKRKLNEVREEIRQEQEGVDPTRTIIEINATHTVLKPGDRVLVTLSDDTSTERAEMVRDTLHERFPDVEFLFLLGAGVVVVPHPTDEERAAHPEARQ